jgi:hypothetical protein
MQWVEVPVPGRKTGKKAMKRVGQPVYVKKINN